MEPKALSYSGLVCLDRSHDCHKVMINHSDCCLAEQLLVGKPLNISRRELNMERVCVFVKYKQNHSLVIELYSFYMVKSIILTFRFRYCSLMFYLIPIQNM